MGFWKGVARRFSYLGRRSRFDQELEGEIQFHLEARADELEQEGLSRPEALAQARREFGSTLRAGEQTRSAWQFRWLEDLRRELQHAVRGFRRDRTFALTAICCLALGIGASTAIFTLIDQLMLRLLPAKNPEQLVMIWSTGPHLGGNEGSRSASYPMYQDFQQKGQAFTHVFCRYLAPLSISFDGQTERVRGELVSGNYFQALGVHPAVGRVFSPEEDDRQYQGHPVAVLSHDYWLNRFGADSRVIGKKILVNNCPMVIVGVSAAGFTGLDPSGSPQIRVPILMKPLMTPPWDDLGNRRQQWIQVFARLKPGHTVESARASLQPLFQQILRLETTEPAFSNVSQYYRDLFMKRTVRMEAAAAGYSPLRQSYSTALIVLMSMVGLVLVIACSNVAGLLIARAAARQKEIAVRLAVGASRGQLLRQLLVESLLLSVVGGMVGLVLSFWMIRGLLSFLPAGGVPLMLRAEPDARILAFNLALALATGVLFGLAPAFQALRVNLSGALKDVAGAVAGPGSSVRLRKGLVTAQVALSFLLLAGAGLFVRTLSNLKNVNPGFRDTGNLLTFQVAPALSGYSAPRMRAFYKQLLENVRAAPGVKAASFASVPLLRGSEWDASVSVEGHQAKGGEDMQAFMNSLSPGYWQTMGVPLLEGRDFDARDEGERPTVAIVNRKFAQHFFGNRSALGRHIGSGRGPGTKLDTEIVGVVDNSLYGGPRQGVHRQAFLPHLQMRSPGSVAFYVRTSLESRQMFSALRREVMKLDPAMPIYEMKTLENQLDETLGTERLIAALSAAFGAVATLLAAVGLYGVMAFVVTRRTQEIGLRMALGAHRGAVVWLVMREVFGLLAIGLAVGLPAAYWLSRYVSSQLFGLSPADLPTALAALAILAAAAAGAGFLPARHASAIDPIRALRYE